MGDVEIATVILIRDHEYVCEDRVAERVRQDAPAPPAKPVNLAVDRLVGGLADDVRDPIGRAASPGERLFGTARWLAARPGPSLRRL